MVDTVMSLITYRTQKGAAPLGAGHIYLINYFPRLHFDPICCLRQSGHSNVSMA